MFPARYFSSAFFSPVFFGEVGAAPIIPPVVFPPPVFDAIAEMVIDDTYAEFGRAATYTPPGGGSAIPCVIIVDLRDEGSRPDDGRPIAGQITIEVRAKEIAAPLHNAQFAFGSRVVTVMNRPQLDEEEGLVWKMWAT